jgi:hypothetical protein
MPEHEIFPDLCFELFFKYILSVQEMGSRSQFYTLFVLILALSNDDFNYLNLYNVVDNEL